MKLLQENIANETHQVMKNIDAILKEANLTFQHVVKTTIFLSDMNLFAEVNEIYAGYFDGDFPARETVAVKGLPKNVNVEISMTAVVNYKFIDALISCFKRALSPGFKIISPILLLKASGAALKFSIAILLRCSGVYTCKYG